MKKDEPKLYTELFVLMVDGYILTTELIQQYNSRYGSSNYKVAKKLYYTLGQAKAYLHYLPKEIKDKVEIHNFKSIGVVVNNQECNEIIIQKAQNKQKEESRRRLAKDLLLRSLRVEQYNKLKKELKL